MKVAIIYNKDVSKVINVFGMQNKEVYNPNTINKVAKCLEDGGHNVGIIDGDMHVIERIQDFMPRVVEGEKMGMVFNMAYGIQGESRYTHIPSMLEMLGIPYVGSSPSGHALALDKIITKIILQKHNLPTPNFWVFSNKDIDASEVVYPVIVKPKMESVSFGLRVVDNERDLIEAVDYIVKEFQQPALVEQFIPGREFCVGLLGNSPVEAFPILEIDLENDPNAIQTYEDKSQKPKEKICPAELSEDIAQEMTRISKNAFESLQLRDFSRVDLRMDQNGNVYILEINSMASLGATGSYVHAAGVAGYDFRDLVNKMLDVAVLRYFTSNPISNENDNLFKKSAAHVRIRGFIRGRQTQNEKLLREFVNTNSFVRNVEGVNLLSGKIKKELSALGFSYQSFGQVEVGNMLFFTNNDEYDVLILSSLDNDVKIADHEYYHESEQKIFGSGIWENKGGIVILISALQALRFIKNLKKLRIGILFTSDSTLQGRIAKKHIKDLANKAKYVLGTHGAFLDGGVVTSRSGAAVYHCNMNLKPGNDADMVAKAAILFYKFLASCADLSEPENGLIVAPQRSSIETNITEPYAHGESQLSVRFNDTNQMKVIDDKIKKLIPKKNKKEINIQVEGGIRRPSMQNTEKVKVLLKKVKSVADKLDINLREEHRWSSADICFIDENKYMIDGLGPSGAKPSKKSEFILKHSLLERSALLATLLTELNENK
jgi:D-alanine-D-alanine ligase